MRTVTRWLDQLGLNRIRDTTSDGQDLRQPGKINARYPGNTVHMDVKKIGTLRDGGGWWAHGRGSAQDKKKHAHRIGYTYLHSMIDGFSRLAYTEALEDEKAVTTIGFFHRAQVFFAAHGITRISRLVTDNDANHTATAYPFDLRVHRPTPATTPSTAMGRETSARRPGTTRPAW